MAPPERFTLIAQTDDEELKKAKKAMEEKDKELQEAKAKIAKLEAQDKPHLPGDDPRGLKSAIAAILKSMDDTKDDEEHKTAKKALMKAMEVFDEGNGEQVNNKTQVGETQDEPKTKVEAKTAQLIAAAIKPYEDKVKQPIINKILTAKVNSGATEEMVESDQKRLTAMTLKAVEDEYESNKIFIEAALKASEDDPHALLAREEKTFEFNGVSPTGLTGKTVSIDKAINGGPYS